VHRDIIISTWRFEFKWKYFLSGWWKNTKFTRRDRRKFLCLYVFLDGSIKVKLACAKETKLPLNAPTIDSVNVQTRPTKFNLCVIWNLCFCHKCHSFIPKLFWISAAFRKLVRAVFALRYFFHMSKMVSEFLYLAKSASNFDLINAKQVVSMLYRRNDSFCYFWPLFKFRLPFSVLSNKRMFVNLCKELTIKLNFSLTFHSEYCIGKGSKLRADLGQKQWYQHCACL